MFLLCDIAVLWLAIHALGYDVPAAPLLLAYLIGYLANAVPIPGGIGVLDGGLAGALLLYHVPAPAALGGVLLYHALALWIPAIRWADAATPPRHSFVDPRLPQSRVRLGCVVVTKFGSAAGADCVARRT